jgi:hypothetical protein
MDTQDTRPTNLPPNNGKRRPVIDERGTLHPSCMHAAEARGVSTATAYARARFQKAGWRFASTADLADAPRSAPSA